MRPVKPLAASLSVLVGLALLPSLAAPGLARLEAQAPELVALRVAKAITVSGEEVEDATILIEGGRIAAIGKGIEVPYNAVVFKHPRGVALPGLIACHTTLGLRVPNENVPNVPYISVLDGIDPSHPAVKSSLRDGVTVAHVIPANATRVGGQGAVVRLTGKTVAEMVVKAPSGLKLSLRPPPGETRMQTMAALRKTFADVYVQVRAAAADAAPPALLSGKPAAPPDLEALLEGRPPWQEIAWEKVPLDRIDAQARPMVDLVRGQIPAFVYCPSASDVFKAFELMDSHGLKGTLVLGPDAYKLAAVLAARKDLGPVVLDADLVVWDTDPDTGEERRHVTPRALFDAGLRFALQAASDGREQGPRFSREGELHLWYQAAQLVKLGIPRAEALKAVTFTPARILGLEHRMGSLEAGKDANVVVFSGDPLDARSWVEQVLIEGKEAYRREADRDLELLLREPERAF
ncbi:MAG: amidohydrolase family protein [Planctomycetes bacterium]|nr:amidohydrolase family protein [Planctomycetota bacterium]